VRAIDTGIGEKEGKHMKQLQNHINYHFKNTALLEQALTHSSYHNENRGNSTGSNERLEFIGDSVLGLLTSEFLYQKYPDMSEGELTRLRSQLVCEPSLSAAACRMSLSEHLRLGRGENNNAGRTRPAVLADAAEAVLAAVYLDGGLTPARRIIRRFLLDIKDQAVQFTDYKTALQEYFQRSGDCRIQYNLISESGPDHAKLFHSEVVIDGSSRGQGEGSSRKDSEQQAAKAALERAGAEVL
jgi:ribonuclease-3